MFLFNFSAYNYIRHLSQPNQPSLFDSRQPPIIFKIKPASRRSIVKVVGEKLVVRPFTKTIQTSLNFCLAAIRAVSRRKSTNLLAKPVQPAADKNRTSDSSNVFNYEINIINRMIEAKFTNSYTPISLYVNHYVLKISIL